MTQPPPSSSDRLRELFTGRGPLVIALAAILIGVMLLCVFALLLVRDFRGGDLVDQGGAPTPFPSPVSVDRDDVIVGGISGATAISLSVNAPASLRVSGEQFAVRPEPIEEDGTWEPELGEARSALWVYGTLINYVIGLPDNDENRDLLENLAAGDEILLTMVDDTRHTFAVTNREYVSQNRIDVFEQSMPGITLILLRARGDERLVVQGDYVVDTSLAENGNGGSEVALGETAQLDQMRLTVTEATALFDRPEAPPGFIFYVIDLQVENVGTTAINLDRLRFTLRDDLGNQYALSAQASQLGLGTYSPPGGLLAAGESAQMSIAYQVPAGLASPSLLLLIGREGGSGQIQVTIPFTGGEAEAAQAATVTLQSAQVTEDGTSITLVGQIANGSSQPLAVNEGNVSLVSNGTVHLILSTNPAFPWIVPAGQTVPFSLTFQRPAGGQAIFTILNRPFQLSGLR